MKRILKYAIGLILALSLVGCSSNNGTKDVVESENNKEETYKVGILQYMEHESLSQSREGFLAELEESGYVDGENIQVDYKNAQGDQANLQSITQQLKDNNDLILNIATPAAQAMANTDQETPQLFTAVTDPVEAKLVESIERPGGNVSGTSDSAPVEKVVGLLLAIEPEIETIGIIYNASEVNSEIQARDAKDYIESLGLKTETITVANTNDVQSAITSLVSKVDGVYLPTDNTVASTIATIGNILQENNIPSVASFDAGVEGALAAYGVDYFSLGRQTGRMAVNLLENGADISTMTVEFSKDLIINVNEDVAQALGYSADEIKNINIE